MAGFDSYDTIQGTVGHRPSGTPDFWIRYFDPCPGTGFNSDPDAEKSAALSAGCKHIGAIASPPSLSGTYADGHADGQTFGHSLQAGAVDGVSLPSNHELYCWLDCEPSEPISSEYWNGFADAINGWEWRREAGNYPLFACLYCAPDNNPNHPCRAVNRYNSTNGLYDCYAAWVPQPQSSNSFSNPPAWPSNIANCAGANNGVPTKLWQWTTQPNNSNTYVDFDEGAPGFNTENYCFVIV
jgi:hypothetical protein